VALVLALGLSSPAAADRLPTVAVLYFDYDGKSEELTVLRKGLTQMLVSDLSDVDGVDLVERGRLQDLLEEQDLARSKRFDKSTALRVGKLLGARFLVLGRYFDLLGTLRVDARVVEVETGRVVRGVGGSGKMDDFLAVEQKLAGDLRGVLASALPPPPKDRPRPKKKRPKKKAKAPKRLKASTAVRYSRALDASDRGDAAVAKKELEAVLEEQPDFTLASLDLAALVK